MKNKSRDNMFKNGLVAFCGILLLASCNEKPVVIDDPRNHPELYKKVDTVERVKTMEVLKQDIYLNDLDPDAGMEIQKDQINMFYRSEQDSIDDYYDYVVNREDSPLIQAEDALLLDTSHMDRDEQFDTLLHWAKEAIRNSKD